MTYWSVHLSSTHSIKSSDVNSPNLTIKEKLSGLLEPHQVLESSLLINSTNMELKLSSLLEILMNFKESKKPALTLKKLKLSNSIWPTIKKSKKSQKISSVNFKNKVKNSMLLSKMLVYPWDVSSKIIPSKIIWLCSMSMFMVPTNIFNAFCLIWFKIKQAKLLVSVVLLENFLQLTEVPMVDRNTH